MVSGPVIEGLPEVERNWVIHRIAWLKGIRKDPNHSPAVGSASMFEDLIAEPVWQQPLSPKLEALAQGQQATFLPSWEETWPFLAGIASLWAALYTGFWIVSGFQTRPAR
jgi:hypothetical protein